jgi:Zn-dependent protease/uncharacterized Zn finger protein (UPF0148 family)
VTISSEPARICAKCGTELAAGLLCCPSCNSLVHSERLRTLSANAKKAEESAQPEEALQCWVEAASLLPEESRQYTVVQQQIERLNSSVLESKTRTLEKPRGIASPKTTSLLGKGNAKPAGFLGLLAIAAAKGKFLLLGLTKASTLFSMLLSLGVYWAAWGWKFAAGIIALLYIHEMGHFIRMKGFGMNPKAPLFIPGVGAFVGMRDKPSSPAQEASIGLAGPLWGLGSCVILFTLYHLTGHGLARALTHTGAWINLFNLTPVWQLDGARGFKALSKNVRWAIVALTLGLWFNSQEGLLLLLLVVTAWRTASEEGPERSDRPAAFIYAALLISLALLAQYSA